jgi:esterase/lipase superfamily enzyme
MMPTPIVYDREGLDAFASTPPEDRTASLTVFYATDRNQTGVADPEKAYGNQRGIVLRLGTARVAMGDEGTSWDDLNAMTLAGKPPALRIADVNEIGPLWTTVPDRDADAVLAGWDPARRDDAERQPAYTFVRQIDAQLARSRGRDIVVLVPGINTDFARPVKMASALAHYMGRDSVFLAYCWPATGSFMDYNRDTETVALTVRNLRDLLLLLSAETTVRRIHLIGYSRGAPIVSAALNELRLIHAFDDVETMRAARKLGTIVYAGPDQDIMVFKGLFLDRIDDLFESYVIYASPRDFALQLSGSLTSGTERLGRPGSGLNEADLASLSQEMTSAFVDVEYAQRRAGEGAAGHSFWYDNPWVSSDLITALKYGLPPAERGLVRTADGATWTFPEDYPQRIRAIVAERAER